jgi:sulfur carrier protein ThiS
MGGYIDTDGDWLEADTPQKLRDLVTSLGFTPTAAYSHDLGKALVQTQEGITIAYNGYVSSDSQNLKKWKKCKD